MKKTFIILYLLLTAAMVLFPASSLPALPPSGAAAAAAVGPAADSAAEGRVSLPVELPAPAPDATAEAITRLYAPPAPGLSLAGRDTLSLGLSTANLPPTQVSPEGCYLPALESQLAGRVNRRRESQTLPALAASAELQRAARLRAREMVRSGCYTHTRPDGSSWSTALESASPLSFPVRGEVFATFAGPGRPDSRVVSQWMAQWEEAPSELESICQREFTELGVGIFSAQVDGRESSAAVILFAGRADGP